MSMLPHYLVSMVTDHLTYTEARFLVLFHPKFQFGIDWGDLFMSESLCRYGLQYQYPDQNENNRKLLMGMTDTTPYEVLVLPSISTLFRQHMYSSLDVLSRLIEKHRPIPILAYMFQLYNCTCHGWRAEELCDCAASENNIEALEWLRDPDTSDGSYPWSERTCATAARYGHIAMLKRLRDPNIDGGVCPWDVCACSRAIFANQLETLIWLRNPETGGGVCPWNKAYGLKTARSLGYLAMVTWIMAQPDDDEN
jgi:hypothetical protein